MNLNEDKIIEIIKCLYPDAEINFEEGEVYDREDDGSYTVNIELSKKLFNEFEKLENLSLGELELEYEKMLNNMESIIDYDYICSLAYWNVNEAAAYSIGINPVYCNECYINDRNKKFSFMQNEKNPEYYEKYIKRLEFLTRLFHDEKINPEQYIKLFLNEKWPIPPCLVTAFEKYCGDIKESSDKIAELQKENERLLLENNKLTNQLSILEDKPNTKKMTSIYKILIGLLIKHNYMVFNISNNEKQTAKKIETILSDIKIIDSHEKPLFWVNDKTIEERIKEANAHIESRK